ncbi:MAG: adenylyl-sulfate kinase [Desulfamplus sp.]|nr:adenylyl-sulfate kinase [Desulfamplus sp.]
MNPTTEINGSVIWVTGLSDSGKSTLANFLTKKLKTNNTMPTLLDGDQLREVFGPVYGYDHESRLKLAYRYSALCKMLASQGHAVIIATIALFHEIHSWNRQHLPGYFEIFLNTPIEELRRRDSKGLYKRYDTGETSCVYGLDLKAEMPLNPDIKIDFDPSRSPESIAGEVFNKLLLCKA